MRSAIEAWLPVAAAIAFALASFQIVPVALQIGLLIAGAAGLSLGATMLLKKA